MPAKPTSPGQLKRIVLLLALVSGTFAMTAQVNVWAQIEVKTTGSRKPFFMPNTEDMRVLQKGVNDYRHQPDSEVAFYAAGCYFVARSATATLETMCKDALKKHPKWASPYYFLAKIADDHFDDILALKYRQEAVNANPCWINLSENYAEKLTDAGRPKEAIRVADDALTVCAGHENEDPVRSVAHRLRFHKAVGLYNLKDFTGAAAALEEISQLERTNEDQKLLAEVYIDAKQPSKALVIANKLVKARENDFRFRFLRARAYAAAEQWQKAIDDLSSCLKLDRSLIHSDTLNCAKLYQSSDVLLLRATLYEKLGKKDLAQKDRTTLKKERADSFKEIPFRSDGKY
jgi:tetratricopeptide (TPR) repeat protein